MQLRFIAVLGLCAALSGGWGCSSPECERQSDCAANQQCVDEMCRDREVIIRPPGDAGPFDTGTATVTDAGFSDGTVADGGGSGDAGVSDAAPDGSVSDTGLGDSGVRDAEPLDGALPQTNRGEVWLGEFQRSPGAIDHVASGRIINDDNATVALQATAFMAPNVQCYLLHRVVVSGFPGDFTATRITASGFANGAYTSVDLTPGILPGTRGTFTTNMNFAPGMWSGSPSAIAFDVVSTGMSDSLRDFTVSLPPPNTSPPSTSLPLQGVNQFVTMPIHLEWGSISSNPNFFVVLELADATREVTLRCVTPDSTGELDVPVDARQAFIAAGPMAPMVMDLRYDSERSPTVPLEMRPDGVLVNFRLSSGVRWDLSF